MKDILKIRNFDSLKKLNYKRARGKLKSIENMNFSIYKAILTLEHQKLLTPELLWELIERRKYYYIEQRKLEWVMRARVQNLPLYSEDIDKYVNMLANITIAVLRIPYEINDKYKDYVYKKENK